MRYLLYLAYLVCFNICAQNTVYNPLKSSGELYQYAKYTCVGNQEFSINEMLLDQSLKFDYLNSNNLNLGFTSSNYWVKFTLQNSSSDKQVYYLETARPVTDKANLYIVNKDTIKQFKSGDQIPFNKRQVKHRATVFKLVLSPNSIQNFYLELGSDGETINVPLNLHTESDFWLMNYKQQLFLGLFYGLLFLAGIIYLFFYTSLKEKTFAYYAFYVFSIALLQGALDGFIFEFILPDSEYINSRAVLITALLSNFFLLKYCEHFLEVDKKLIKFKRFYNFIYLVIGLLFLMVFITPKTMELVYPISNLNGLFSLILILSTLFFMRFSKMPLDVYFSIGIFFLVLGLLGFVMNNLGFLPNNFFTLNSAKFGAGFEVIFLSLSMTNLIKKLREDKEESQLLALNRTKEISQLKTFFMSNISHELRTPINAIMGIAESELKSKSEQSENYEIIKNASLSLLSNVNDILDFEKIEQNQLMLEKQVFNPVIAVNDICNNWKIEAERKGLNFNFKIDSEIPNQIESDSQRFIQIINNVLSNAVKFTSSGHISFNLKCFSQPNDIKRFYIKISDTGIGISQEKQKYIFDSFNQMRNNHKRKYGGIGLGLTIVKQLVKLFDGEITIESKINEGTNVYIDLPIKVLKTKKVENNTTVNKSNITKPIKILIAEDNTLNQLVIKKLLASDKNSKVTIVNNGKEAISKLKNNTYEIILMDLQMPVMDGYEATKLIRSGKLGETVQNIPIIAISADVIQETKTKVIKIGMNDYLSKPLSKELLFQKINDCIDKANVLKIA